MPIYEFECNKCKKRIEKLLSIPKAEENVHRPFKCSYCEDGTMHLTVSGGTSFEFKGPMRYY